MISNYNNYSTNVKLSPGCYTFRMFDTGDDGLEWWANSAQGSGNVQLSQIFPPPPFIVLFNSDFGSEIIHNFTVGYALNIDKKNDEIINIYPNPTKNQVTIETNNKKINKISIYNSFGQSIKTFFPNNNKIQLKTIDMSPGYYIIKITSDNKEYYKKLIITN